MATFHHRNDCGVVTLSADLTWAEARDMVCAIDTLVDLYFYLYVEVVISSLGGNVAALDYYLAAVRCLRARGVRLRTYAVDTASSAAAIMLSLADERVAEPGARLLYHAVRSPVQGLVTASQSAEIHADLIGHDARFIARLAERAVRDARGVRSVPSEAEPSDLPVLDRLLGAKVVCAANGSRRARTLARALGRDVAKALRQGDTMYFARLYQTLFALDTAISPKLAVTLRLIDHVGRPEPSQPYAVAAPAITIPEWRALCPPDGGIARELLLRNLLALGETGSGKTLSFILPILFALLRLPLGRFGGAFVIDPKRELAPVLQRAMPGRVHLLRPADLVVNVMAGSTQALLSDLSAGLWLTAAHRILLRMASFVPNSPAYVLAPHLPTNSNDEFFCREGTALLATVLAFVLAVTAPGTSTPEDWSVDEDWLDADADALAWLRALRLRAQGAQGRRGVNALALASWALAGELVQPPSEDDSVPVERRWLFARVARRATSLWPSDFGETPELLDQVHRYWTPMVSIDRQYAGVLATARSACAEFAQAGAATRLYFGCEPGYRPDQASAPAHDFPRLVSRDASGAVVLFQPGRDPLDTLLALSLKALFFEAVLSDPDRVRGGADLPLVAYVADEFHRYVSSDPLHGEQSFLDTCRSFGAFCALACQSVASVEHALACGAGDGTQDRAAVEILWTNCASKVFFRSTDPKTAARLDDLSPYRPGLAGVTRVRPPSTLAPGECYAATADGRFQRRQLAPFVEAASLEQAPSPRSRGRRARGAA